MGANDQTPAREFMTKNPVAVAMDDDCALAASSIREYRLKSLPVVEGKDNRKLAGSLRVRRLMAYVFHEMGDETSFLHRKDGQAGANAANASFAPTSSPSTQPIDTSAGAPES